ncbi:MAG: cytochrome C biogenesis protein [Anaerolineaceae bacterium]
MPSNQYKIEIFLPEEALDSVMGALTRAHAGVIGDYDRCFAFAPVTGTFRPGEGAHPYIGAMGEITYVNEIKLEVNCRGEDVAGAIQAVRKVHPYEEPVINVVELHNGEFGATQ